MGIEVNSGALPQVVSETGIITGSRRSDSDSSLRHVTLALKRGLIEAIAHDEDTLTQALEGPLVARLIRLAYLKDSHVLPLLLECSENPFLSGLYYVPESTCPAGGVVAGVLKRISTIRTDPLRQFLVEVFQRRDIFQYFWTMPASARHHHAGPGGLAIHSLEVADDLANHRGLSEVELDVGVAGALLHDIGKVWSYTEDMFPNDAGMAMGHELVGLCRLEPELTVLESKWPDGAYVMRSLLSGQTRMRANGSFPPSLLPRIKACDQRSCEQDRCSTRSPGRPVWTPSAWEEARSQQDIGLS